MDQGDVVDGDLRVVIDWIDDRWNSHDPHCVRIYFSYLFFVVIESSCWESLFCRETQTVCRLEESGFQENTRGAAEIKLDELSLM